VVPEQLANTVNVVLSLCRIFTVYPVIAKPPSAGATQFKITLEPEITLVGASGVLGAVGIAPPFPAGDAAEEPIALVAVTLA
jgi:hypothetical protein